MNHLPKKLKSKLKDREAANALRQLGKQNSLVDFSSNDYLGFAKSESIFDAAHDFLMSHNIKQNGATGSRLLSGNHPLYPILETILSDFHNSESALIFNSGYDANIGFFSSVPQRGDIILYDEYIHASIRDGIAMSHAKAYKFKHNDLESLSEMLKRVQHDINVYVVTESVFSMDGDSPDLKAMSQLCKTHQAYFIVDEAHAVGVFGNHGVGLIQELGLENQVFARLVTFGKALGCHGAAILTNKDLKAYLVNFSRSFIYTTALPPHSLATIHAAYHKLIETENRIQLHQNISFFKSEVIKNKLQDYFIDSHSAIHCCVVSGNDTVKAISQKLKEQGFDVKPILSPTVPKGEERLRFCLHTFNSKEEITKVLQLLATFVSKHKLDE
ncbi:8-amino-7-oxononanoate synthase [Yeosuana aromativorans]|uniref:8-amino-7-oxononanoate synthase n=1 Tax=Yeosuana aromativorans TaxID=288019 RepID=A0A8J3FL18_9FLAO|nr:8-amino-7-oxononanoate synthase [Yeosuana aromativorans]GGK31533.1 8-amino-7-oxononanoate synthase [Yeosuana aromativorans]